LSSQPKPIEELIGPLGDLLAWLRASNVKGLIIGGVAASLVAKPRLTQDVDAILWLERDRLAAFVDSAATYGFKPRIDDVLGFARRHLVLQFRHERTQVPVDLSLAGTPFEKEAIEGANFVRYGDLEVPVPRPEDLMIMKAIAFRDKDRPDMQHLLEAYPDLDRKRIIRVLRPFAELLDEPERVGEVERLMARYPPRKKR
jgi:hypothetical protein